MRACQTAIGPHQDYVLGVQAGHVVVLMQPIGTGPVTAIAGTASPASAILSPTGSAALLVPSEHFSVSDYGYIVGGAGVAAAFVALLAADLADKFSRIRVLLWGMLIPIGFMFGGAGVPSIAL